MYKLFTCPNFKEGIMKSNFVILALLILTAVTCFVLFVTRTPDSPVWFSVLDRPVVTLVLIATIFYYKRIRN